MSESRSRTAAAPAGVPKFSGTLNRSVARAAARGQPGSVALPPVALDAPWRATGGYTLDDVQKAPESNALLG